MPSVDRRMRYVERSGAFGGRCALKARAPAQVPGLGTGVGLWRHHYIVSSPPPHQLRTLWDTLEDKLEGSLPLVNALSGELGHILTPANVGRCCNGVAQRRQRRRRRRTTCDASLQIQGLATDPHIQKIGAFASCAVGVRVACCVRLKRANTQTGCIQQRLRQCLRQSARADNQHPAKSHMLGSAKEPVCRSDGCRLAL